MNLRDKVLKLAHENPELREHLLPLVKEAALPEAEYTLLNDSNTLALVAKNFKKALRKDDTKMTHMIKVNVKSALGALANALRAVEDEAGASAIESAQGRVRL